jgi:hypothetical protein
LPCSWADSRSRAPQVRRQFDCRGHDNEPARATDFVGSLTVVIDGWDRRHTFGTTVYRKLGFDAVSLINRPLPAFASIGGTGS